MKKSLRFEVAIEAPKALVWQTMLAEESYKHWTSVFCEGSHYVGSWEEGSKIRFLTPGGDGVTAEIAENRRYEFVSIRHLGEVKDGVEDTKSEAVRAWAPAYEKFLFSTTEGGTEVIVELETTPKYEDYMLDTYPRALNRLKELCESNSRSR